jgi:TonB family protein
MRKTTFVSTFSCCIRLFCLVVLGIIYRPVSAQDATPASAPAKEAPVAAMPSHPKELMLLAAKTNGLTGPDVQPWHLKATWQMLDEKGSIKDEGTYEEFWAGPTKFKRTYTGSAFTQTTYGTENGVLRSGARDFLPEPFTQIRNEIVTPIVIAGMSIEYMSSGKEKVDQGRKTLLCAGFGNNTRSQSAQFVSPTYCFDTDVPSLRISMRWGEISQFVRNNLVSFQDRYLPGDLLGFRGTKLALKVHLETAEMFNSINEEFFTPTPDAISIQPKITLSPTVAQQQQLQQDEPVYPPIARAARVEGTVVLQVIIGKDGRVLSLKVISGPAMLQQATFDAVKKWVYKPYLLNGEPVEVNATINVVFKLGSAPHAIP